MSISLKQKEVEDWYKNRFSTGKRFTFWKDGDFYTHEEIMGEIIDALKELGKIKINTKNDD